MPACVTPCIIYTNSNITTPSAVFWPSIAMSCFLTQFDYLPVELTKERLANFVRAVERSHQSSDAAPYHNTLHVADVLQSMHALMTTGGMFSVSFQTLTCQHIHLHCRNPSLTHQTWTWSRLLESWAVRWYSIFGLPFAVQGHLITAARSERSWWRWISITETSLSLSHRIVTYSGFLRNCSLISLLQQHYNSLP